MTTRHTTPLRVLAALLVLILSLGLLTGCGSTNSSSSAQDTASEASSSPNSQTTSDAQSSPESTPDTAPENTGASITVGIAQDLDSSLDPHLAVAAGTKEIMFNVFEGLVKPTPDGELVPAVASDVYISDDGLTYTFTLREGVKFHNGDTVELEDVIYSIDRNRGESALIPALDIIDTISGEGDTLTLTLSEPSGELLNYLTLAILPADYTEQDTKPVGTGPFRFVSRAAQDNLVLERFDDYWGTPAKFERVTFRVIENNDGLVLGLQSGALDLVAHMTTTQTDQLSPDDFTILEGSMNLVQALYLNNAEPPFDDVRVRQALSYAIDKRQIIDLAFDGYGIPLGTSMFPSFAKYYDDSLTDYYTPDVEKAKSLLAEAGYPDGLDMTITVPSNYQPHMDTAQVIVEQLKAVGVRATIEPVEWATWLSDVYSARQYMSTITGLTSDNMTARKLLERFTSTASNNFTNYNNPDYDALCEKALSAIDDTEQTALYREMERMLTETAANVYIQDMADLVAVRKGLTGLQFYPLYVLDMSTVSWS